MELFEDRIGRDSLAGPFWFVGFAVEGALLRFVVNIFISVRVLFYILLMFFLYFGYCLYKWFDKDTIINYINELDCIY